MTSIAKSEDGKMAAADKRTGGIIREEPFSQRVDGVLQGK